MNLDDIDEQNLGRIFSNPADRESRAWILTTEPMQALTKIPAELGSPDARFYIFNEFENQQLYLYNYDYLYCGKNDIKFLPSVVCDSNVATLLHRRVAEPSRLSPHHYAAAQD